MKPARLTTAPHDKIVRMKNSALPVLKEDWQGNIVINGKFRDDTSPQKAPGRALIKWMLSRNPRRAEKRNDKFRLPVQRFDPATMHENSIVWLGHSSFLIDVGGVRLITDPCFFDLPSGRRKVPLPCPAEALKTVHYLLVSHDHRDHFDKKSVEVLAQNNPGMEALIPLCGNRLFHSKKLSGIRRQEAGWWQEYNLTEGVRTKESVRVVFLPARHWGRRGLNDSNKTLWGSFLIIAGGTKGGTKIFFAGDTAYNKQMFKDIWNVFGDIDICLLPIGAYSPPFMMQTAHMNPEEAAQAFMDLGGKCLIPMHYGTFNLSDEPPGEPLARLFRSDAGDKTKALAIGEIFLI